MTAPNASWTTEVRPYGLAAISASAELIRAGLPVAVPTETVYGLACDATSAEAVARVYAAKGRPDFNPLIVHVLDQAEAENIAIFGDLAATLADAFWPGPLTMVLPLRGSKIASLATAGLSTIAIRVPAHPAMRDLLAATRVPLAAPSANASGAISPTRARHVLKSLASRIPLIIDAGATALGLESTIVAVAADRLRLLRPGPVTIEMLREATGRAVTTQTGDAITAPGQLASHYAPSKPLRLDAREAREGEFLIGFGTVEGAVSLSPAGDCVQAAARLFDLLHAADASDAPSIAVAPLPDLGLGVAINDRLRRAAAPRS